MGSCAAPSAKGDDKFITTDYLQQCRPVKVPRKEEEEKAPEQNYDEVIKALKAAGIDPLKLAEALSAMKPEN
ncbi:hypothetical protein LL01C3_46920 [Escherichia coli]